MNKMNYKKLYLFGILLTFLVPAQAQDFDDEFLESLPDQVKEDLLKRNSAKEELEEDRYRRPSSYVEKDRVRKEVEDLKRQLQQLEDKLSDDKEGKELDKRFGSKIFSLMQTTLMPFNEPNFDASYTLDYGDVLELQIIGQKSNSLLLPIKRDGSINIPDVGKLRVAGLSLENASNTITETVKSSSSSIVNAFVTLVSVRDIQVIVAGNVFSPGPYTLNGNSSLFHALTVSGGPSDNGSFRKIELVRENKVIETADIYETFIYGKSSFSTRLRSGDLIFVKPVSNLVTISGAVKRPGIYELTEDENLFSALSYANGVNNRANLSEISLVRIKDGKVKNFNINNLSEFKDLLSNDNDRIVIGSFSYRSVEIKGAVKNPGTYLINEGAGILDLVTIAGGYTETAYPFGGILENLQTEDINKMAGEKLYESFIDELSRLSSNPAAATDMTFLAEIISEIKNTKASGRVSAEFNLEKLKNDKSLDIFLQEGDVITIPEFLNHIYVFGEINTEGTIRFKEGEKVDYYIDNKGGFNPYANKKNVYILHPNGETSLVSRKRNVFMSARGDDIELYPGSVIFIPRDTVKVPFSVAAQAYASILGNIGVSLASVSVLKD